MEKNSNFTVYYVSAGRSVSQTDITTHSVSIPVLARFRLNNLITIHAGPEFDILTYDNENLLKSNESPFKKTTGGAVGGLELTLAPSFDLFGSYYYNISNMNNIDNRYQWHYSQLRFGIKVRVF